MHGAIDLVLKSKLGTIIHPYSRCTDKTIQVHAIVCLCQLQSEDGKDMFLQDEILVLTLTDAIRHALNSPDHCYAEVQLSFLLKGLAQLASKDTNHSILLSNGVIDLLKSVVRVGDVKESNICMNAFWLLSFDPSAKQLMRDDSELMDMLDTQSKCDMQNTRNAADAVIKQVEEIDASQVIGGNDESNEETTDEQELIKTEQETPKKRKHVMISYQWDTQEILLRVRDKLKECGYELWMDVDNIGGSTLQAMAEAVEESAVVLVCYSHRYKSSPNARTEAEYAFQLRRDIIPLKMEKGYQADGWLGAIIGTKLYIDVDPEGNGFDTSMKALIKELGDRGIKQDADVTGAVAPKTEIVTRTSVNAVTQWTRLDVIQWAKQNSIKSRKVANMTGEDLLFLQNLRKEAPEYFFGTLERKLGIRSLNQIRIMSTALKNL
ncbi:uncharacterized protein LOC117111170 [Anneissia japonica]|uniref:uncharacterized protein LOC117111170 n=1 Tax=Anneissia japonica TaxID=1529436 RepID=UPI0014258381|nr:uncharacterized protein LOC117111170 [Anneissia japonica]XP_033109935.1 uncharacterized protein LOC117111170 [Anneissia japonica]